jgi:hypothetical protein
VPHPGALIEAEEFAANPFWDRSENRAAQLRQVPKQRPMGIDTTLLL